MPRIVGRHTDKVYYGASSGSPFTVSVGMQKGVLMTGLLIVLVLLAQWAVSFGVLCKAWLYCHDVELADAIFFGMISIIPVAFVAAFLIFVIQWFDHTFEGREIG
jgi:hypothetical protein